MAELVGGAALGAIFGQLLKVVSERTQRTAKFKTQFTRLEKTLKSCEPVLREIAELSKVLNHSDEETQNFIQYLEDGNNLVARCSKIKFWNVKDRYIYANKLIHLNNELLWFFQIETTVNCLRTGLKISIGVNELNEKFDRLLSTATSGGGGFSGSCNVPNLPKFVIGFDHHLQKLKKRLLEDATRLLTISGPGGFGKTTLAKMVCHDEEIKGIFGDNILYVTVSKETNLISIAQSLFKHYGITNFDFKTEEDAKNKIENLITQKGPCNMLLVLDDVWPESKYVIRDLRFVIPGFKILVTSRSKLQEFNSTYDLSVLNFEDAKTLFCHSAFPDGILVNSLPSDLVNKMVKVCSGLPLALTIVGASLCGEPEIVWKSTHKKWFEGQSILESHQQLLVCLQTSIDALDELHENVKECFLDLGMFPEDDLIAGTTLMDIWVESYKLDDEDASLNLLHLSSRNLINLVPIRKVAGETEGHCSQYRVTQHDVIRELAIHMNKQEPSSERKRLIIEINSNNLPEWWTQDTQQCANASILSISTDEEFNSNWYDLNAPNVEVLMLNIRSKNYTLPQFIKRMSQLKVLIITGYGPHPTRLDNLNVLASLTKISRIRFEHVSLSTSAQVIFTLKTLKKLTLVVCKIGDAFNNGTNRSSYMLDNLKDLEINLCYDLKELPAGICRSVHLQKLIITNCQELDHLPEDLGNLSNLEILRVHCCTNLKELPESIGSMCKLRIIDISECLNITALPEQISELNNLKTIDVSGCKGLDKLPMSMVNLKQLEDVWCDEERSCLWKNIESELCNMKITIVEEDTTGTFKRICSNLS